MVHVGAIETLERIKMTELLKPLTFEEEVDLAIENPLAMYVDDQLIAIGTRGELVRATGLSSKTIKNYMTKHFTNRSRGKIEIVRIEDPEYNVKKLGKNLRRARKNRGLTCKEVETLTGIHPSTISCYERGSNQPSLERLKLLASTYEVPLAELVY